MNSLKTLDGIILRRLELLLSGAKTKEETVKLLHSLVKHYSYEFLNYANTTTGMLIFEEFEKEYSERDEL